MNKLQLLSDIVHRIYGLSGLKIEQTLSRNMIISLQEKKLRQIIRHAYNNVQYYRELFDTADITPEKAVRIEDLQNIPVTTRRHLQQTEYDKVLSASTDIGNCINYKTGGSTGMPLNIYLDIKEMHFRHIFAEFMYLENGFGIKDRTLRIFEKKYFKKRNLLNKIGIMDRRFLVLDTPCDEIAEVISSWKPDLVISYPSKMVEIAQAVQAREINPVSVRAVFTSGEVLSDSDRKYIEDVFKADVYDYYAANECGVIGWECLEHAGYHINSSNVIVETLDDSDRPVWGREGRIIVTSLSNHTMPFLRYDTGDLGILTDEYCPCKRKTPLIKNIIGRNLQFLHAEDRVINPWYLTNAVENHPGISAYQVVQVDGSSLIVNIVPDDDFDELSVQDIIADCSEAVSGRMEIEVIIRRELSYVDSNRYVTVSNGSDKFKGGKRRC